MTVTIADVARRAGVGRGTVSRVLNDRPNVDPATRARVRAAIEELGFVPSTVARRLSLGRSHAVAVAIALDERPRTLALLRGLARVFGEAGLDLLLVDAGQPARRASFVADVTTGGRADGIVFVGFAPGEDEAAILLARGVPAIVVDAVHPSLPSFDANPEPRADEAARRGAEIGAARLLDAIAARALEDADEDAETDAGAEEPPADEGHAAR